MNEKCPIFETVAKGDSNPGSLDCESGILPLSYCAPLHCKAIVGEHITTQHQPVVFVVRMNRASPNKIVGRKTIKWWKCIDGVATEYRQRVKEKYEELGEEVDNVEE